MQPVCRKPVRRIQFVEKLGPVCTVFFYELNHGKILNQVQIVEYQFVEIINIKKKNNILIICISRKRASDISSFPLEPCPLGPLMFPSCYSRSNRSKDLKRNGDPEAIVVGAGLCDGEGDLAYTGCAATLEGECTKIF